MNRILYSISIVKLFLIVLNSSFPKPKFLNFTTFLLTSLVEIIMYYFKTYEKTLSLKEKKKIEIKSDEIINQFLTFLF